MAFRRILTAAILVILGIYTQWLAKQDAQTPIPTSEAVGTPTPSVGAETLLPAPDGFTRIASVVDGDTIELHDGTKVRYIGVNTPETVHPSKPVECFGKEASDYNKQLLANGLVRLEKDVSNTDRYGRLLRYVYLPDGTFVNLKLITDGYAYTDTYPPDVAHAKEFISAQQTARKNILGLWASCPHK